MTAAAAAWVTILLGILGTAYKVAARVQQTLDEIRNVKQDAITRESLHAARYADTGSRIDRVEQAVRDLQGTVRQNGSGGGGDSGK